MQARARVCEESTESEEKITPIETILRLKVQV